MGEARAPAIDRRALPPLAPRPDAVDARALRALARSIRWRLMGPALPMEALRSAAWSEGFEPPSGSSLPAVLDGAAAFSDSCSARARALLQSLPGPSWALSDLSGRGLRSMGAQDARGPLVLVSPFETLALGLGEEGFDFMVLREWARRAGAARIPKWRGPLLCAAAAALFLAPLSPAFGPLFAPRETLCSALCLAAALLCLRAPALSEEMDLDRAAASLMGQDALKGAAQAWAGELGGPPWARLFQEAWRLAFRVTLPSGRRRLAALARRESPR